MPGYTLDQVQSSYHRLLAQYNARQIPWEQLVAQVGQLRAQDPQGVWWTIEPRSGGWLRYDGRQWVPGQPQFSPPPKAGRPTCPVRDAHPGSSTRQPEGRPGRAARQGNCDADPGPGAGSCLRRFVVSLHIPGGFQGRGNGGYRFHHPDHYYWRPLFVLGLSQTD